MPASLTNLEQVRSLNVSGNPVKSIHADFSKLRKLENFSFQSELLPVAEQHKLRSQLGARW